MLDGRAERFEIFVMWYLRFNGYFTVPSFVVHAGDDSARISQGAIGNLTEVDTLAVRLPFSREESGIQFPTDRNLMDGAEGRFDVVIAEVKSGEGNSPNRIWRKGETAPVEYLLRFVGWHSDASQNRRGCPAGTGRATLGDHRDPSMLLAGRSTAAPQLGNQ